MLKNDNKMNINQSLLSFAQKDLTLSLKSEEYRLIEKTLHRLESGLNRKWKKAIEEIIPFGSYSRNTLLPRKYDPVTDIDLLVVITKKYRLKYLRNTPMFFRKMLLNHLNALYPNETVREDFPAVRLELDFLIFDIVPALFEYGGKPTKKIYSIPNHDLKWEPISRENLKKEIAEKNKEFGNNIVRYIIRLCKHFNAAWQYPFKSFSLENKILRSSFSSDANLYDTFVNILSQINTNSGDISGEISRILKEINYHKNNSSSFNNEETQLNNLIKLLPGLQPNWVGFPNTSKYWKSKNEEARDGMHIITRYFDADGNMKYNTEY